MGSTVYIYALIDPRTEEVRYIGKSVNTERRLIEHCRKARLHPDCWKDYWLKHLQEAGFSPRLTVLEETDEDNWEEREREWIALYRGMGNDLTNVSEGGEGSASGDANALAKLTRSGVVSILHRYLEGCKSDDLAREYGVNHGTIRRALRGENWQSAGTAELRAQVRMKIDRERSGGDHPLAKIQNKDVPLILQRYVNGEYQKDLAQEYGVTQRAIGMLVRGVTFRKVPRSVVVPAGRDVSKSERCVWPVARKRGMSAEDLVRELRSKASTGTRIKELASEYGLSRATMQALVYGQNWKGVEAPLVAKQGKRLGSEAPAARVTEDDVREIRAKYAAGLMYKDIATEYGISDTAVWSIATYRTWKHVDPEGAACLERVATVTKAGIVQRMPSRWGRLRGEEAPRAKLTNEQVRAIRSRYAAGGVTQRQLAKEYEIEQGNISVIVNRKTYRDA